MYSVDDRELSGGVGSKIWIPVSIRTAEDHSDSVNPSIQHPEDVLLMARLGSIILRCMSALFLE